MGSGVPPTSYYPPQAYYHQYPPHHTTGHPYPYPGYYPYPYPTHPTGSHPPYTGTPPPNFNQATTMNRQRQTVPNTPPSSNITSNTPPTPTTSTSSNNNKSVPPPQQLPPSTTPPMYYPQYYPYPQSYPYPIPYQTNSSMPPNIPNTPPTTTIPPQVQQHQMPSNVAIPPKNDAVQIQQTKVKMEKKSPSPSVTVEEVVEVNSVKEVMSPPVNNNRKPSPSPSPVVNSVNSKTKSPPPVTSTGLSTSTLSKEPIPKLPGPIERYGHRPIYSPIEISDGFSMERSSQNLLITVDDKLEGVISETQIIRVDHLEHSKPLKIQVWFCECHVDKLKEKAKGVFVLGEKIVEKNLDEYEFQDLLFKYAPKPAVERTKQFLRFVLVDDENILGYCDSATFSIISKKAPPTTAPKLPPTSNIQPPPSSVPFMAHMNGKPQFISGNMPVQFGVMPPTHPTGTTGNNNGTVNSQKNAQKPTMEFLLRFISRVPPTDDLISWLNILTDLSYLDANDALSFIKVSDGTYHKRVEATHPSIEEERNRRRLFQIYFPTRPHYIDECGLPFGPSTGDIEVTVTMKYLDVFDLDDICVELGDKKVKRQDFIYISPTILKFKLPALDSNDILGIVDLTVRVSTLGDTYSHTLNDAFEYISLEEFERRKFRITGTPIQGANLMSSQKGVANPNTNHSDNTPSLVRFVTVQAISKEEGDEIEDLTLRQDLCNADTSKYLTRIYFDPSVGHIENATKRFNWILRKFDTNDNVLTINGPQTPELEGGGVYTTRIPDSILRKDSTMNCLVLEIPIEIDRRITSEKYNCLFALRLRDLVTSQIHYNSKPINVSSKAPKPIQFASRNEDERVLSQLEKLKKPVRRNLIMPGMTLQDPNLNALGQNKLHVACLSGSTEDIGKVFNLINLHVLDFFMRNPLHIAFASGNFEAAKFCIERCRTPHEFLFQRDYYHMTPFHLALKFKQTRFLNAICRFINDLIMNNKFVMVDNTPAQPTPHQSGNGRKRKEAPKKSTAPPPKVRSQTSAPIPSKQSKPVVEEDNEEEDDVLFVDDDSEEE
ncbi:hypothetical protein ABK040_008620 [Willaertia magna]